MIKLLIVSSPGLPAPWRLIASAASASAAAAIIAIYHAPKDNGTPMPSITPLIDATALLIYLRQRAAARRRSRRHDYYYHGDDYAIAIIDYLPAFAIILSVCISMSNYRIQKAMHENVLIIDR